MKKLLGLDIGTTTVSAVAISAFDGQVLSSCNKENDATLPNSAGRMMQNPHRILEIVTSLRKEMEEKHGRFDAIGVTGQMHGILYLDREHNPVSPLYTWQDGGGDLSYQGESYASWLSNKTGYPLASGFGLVTDFVNRSLGEVPDDAAVFCTIGDYIVSALCGCAPKMHSSNAASLGCYDLARQDFDPDALAILGISRDCLPTVTNSFKVVGYSEDGVPVTVAIGDNQASVIGSVCGENSALVNIGTGSQISVITGSSAKTQGIEIRPVDENLNILVGAPLCGGRSFALLKNFFNDCIRSFGLQQEHLYAYMDKMAELDPDNHQLIVDTRFCGTRSDPLLRGSITNIGLDNFTPPQLTRGFLYGMAHELYEFYSEMEPLLPHKTERLAGSGNAVRNSSVLRHYLTELFGMELCIPRHQEEAAFGAAIAASVGAGFYPNLGSAQTALIHYL